jgi:sulfate adenylyltransferase subunit 2
MRIHPLLNWSELDIWKYIEKEKIPVNSLYFSKNGERFRSLGCVPCTKSFPSTASNICEIIKELKVSQSSERGGRLSSREQLEIMQRLRAMGYF